MSIVTSAKVISRFLSTSTVVETNKDGRSRKPVQLLLVLSISCRHEIYFDLVHLIAVTLFDNVLPHERD